MIFFKIEHTQSTYHFCLACLLSFDEQPGWAELVRRLGVSNLEKSYIFGILMKNCTKYVSPSQIRDVVGTPNVMHDYTTLYELISIRFNLNCIFLPLIQTGVV